MMADTNDATARLVAIKERAAKATAGPWWKEYTRDNENPDDKRCLIKYRWNDVPTWLAESSCHENRENDFDFACAAREDVPWLIAYAEKLQRERDELRRLVQQEIQRCENFSLHHPSTIPSDCMVAVLVGLQFALDPTGMEAKASAIRCVRAAEAAAVNTTPTTAVTKANQTDAENRTLKAALESFSSMPKWKQDYLRQYFGEATTAAMAAETGMEHA